MHILQILNYRFNFLEQCKPKKTIIKIMHSQFEGIAQLSSGYSHKINKESTVLVCFKLLHAKPCMIYLAI